MILDGSPEYHAFTAAVHPHRPFYVLCPVAMHYRCMDLAKFSSALVRISINVPEITQSIVNGDKTITDAS